MPTASHRHATRRTTARPVGAALTLFAAGPLPPGRAAAAATPEPLRQRTSLDAGWRFHRGDPDGPPVGLVYDAPAPAALRPWILPTANPFVADVTRTPGGTTPITLHVTADGVGGARVTVPLLPDDHD